MKRLFASALALILAACSKEKEASSAPDPEPEAPLFGRLLYGHESGGVFHIYLESLKPDGSLTELLRVLPGRFPRWSPDGTQFAFFREVPGSEGRERPGAIWVANSDPADPNPILVTENAIVADNALTCPLDWHPDGLRIVHLPKENSGNGLALTTVATGDSELFGRTDLPYSGEPQYDASGKRLIVRGTRGFFDGLSWRPVMSIDTTTGEHTIYALGCCSSISPDGSWTANNTPLHRYMDLWSADFKTGSSYRAKTVLPTHGLWDDWHWTNHSRYITTRSDRFPQDGTPDDAFLIDLLERKSIPLTSNARGTDWPDFYVDGGPPNIPLTPEQIKAVPRDALAEVAAFAEAKRHSTEGVPTQIVRAKLRAITPIPPESTRAYPNYLIDAEWELLEVISGEWISSRFTGVHYAIKEDVVVPGTAALKVGDIATLTVQAWDARPELHALGRIGPDTLDFDRKEVFVKKIR